MKKHYLFLLIISAAVAMQSCKKSSTTPDEETTPPVLQAYINAAAWTPDTLSATITYNSTAKTKVFTFNGQKNQNKIDVQLNEPNPKDDNSITLTSYKVDDTSQLLFVYSKQVKGPNGSYIFEPYGTVKPNSGSLVIKSIDTDKKTISGSFNFISSKTTYGDNGDVISIDLAPVTGGSFTNMPYTFVRQ